MMPPHSLSLTRPQSIWRTIAGLMALLAGLCTLLALVVTALDAWSEHAQAQWPEATARIRDCALDQYTSHPENYLIECSIEYPVGADIVHSKVRSRTTPAPNRLIRAYPADTFERMQQWVAAHGAGTPLTVHYNPADPTRAALRATDMPLGGPRTPGNLKLLGGAAAIFAVLCVAVYLARRL
jgi:hypothetical protein